MSFCDFILIGKEFILLLNSSSVTPYPHHHATKIHPVLSKYQAHMALAAASQKHQNHLKHHLSFSPPSQIISNYASFGPATSNPFWHHGLNNHNSQFQLYHDSQKFHHHVHKLPDPKPQQQVLPSVHPSVITPFLEQVQLKQKEASAAEQKNTYKHSHEGNSQENNGSYEMVNDVFSKHLVPPPPSNVSPTHYKLKATNTPEKHEKGNKYNLSMPSPLQDASRFNYNNVISTPATPAPIENYRFRPSASDNTFVSTEKPNVFVNLNNRTKENVYKQHKLLHPSYTGHPKKRPVVTIEKPFLPTPYRPGPDDGQFHDNHELHHSFFTIEDAVTPHLSYQVVKSHIPVDEAPDSIIYNYPQKANPTSTTSPPLTTTSSTEKSTHKPRQKLRRRKPKPQQQVHKEKPVVSEEIVEVTAKPNRVRGSIKNVDTQTEQNNLKTRNRVNHPNRVRSRLNFSSPAATLSTVDYDSTIKSSTEEEQRHEVSTVQHLTTEPSAILKSSESSEQPENVKRRVRLRYRNKLRTNTNSLEAVDFKQKLPDNHIADTEHENVVVKQSYETTESSIATDSGFNEIRSSLKLPNLKLRNEALTTFPTSSDITSTSVQPSSTLPIEPEENNILSKIINRPRFSIKEYKKKQLSTSSIASTTMTSTTTSPTTTKPDSQRFNRLRVNFNRRRNETGSAEETEGTRRRPAVTRSSTTTTESSVQTTTAYPKRGSLPKRTFANRNFTRPSTIVNDSETTTSAKPIIKNATTFNSNRPSTPNLRSRIQSYKAKESTSESSDLSPNTIKNVNISAEVPIVVQEQYVTTSTESPYKHETSIMKIAKTPSSVSSEKATTNNFLEDTTNRNEFDLTGSPSEYSQRVAELTISGNENYSFKSANIGPLSRRIPNYFTISTDDPILPIQAFFPQIKTNEDVSLIK